MINKKLYYPELLNGILKKHKGFNDPKILKTINIIRAGIRKSDIRPIITAGTDFGFITDEDLDAPLDLPFSLCVFEDIDKNILSLVKNEDDLDTYKEIRAVLVMEHGGDYIFADLYYKGSDKGIALITKKSPDSYKSRLGVIRRLCKTLNNKKNKTGSVKTNTRIKLDAYSGKTIKRLVVISDSNQKSLTSIKLGTEVDWSHAWEVRGHWRSVKGLGRNRCGDYCIEGYTWVSPHVKGKGDLLTKTRFKPGVEYK